MKTLHRYALLAVTTGVLAATTTLAFAADSGPSVEQLQQDCGTVAKDCQLLKVREKKDFLGERKQVGQVAWGCASGGGTQAITWSDTTGTTTSVSGTASVSGGLATVINAGFSATFGHSWTTSKTVADTTSVSVKYGKVAWIVRAPAMQSVVGDLSMWYPKQVDGHYNWIIENLTVAGPSEAPGNVIILDRDMTAVEKAEMCGGNPGPSIAAHSRRGVVLTNDTMDLDTAQGQTLIGGVAVLPGAAQTTDPTVRAGE